MIADIPARNCILTEDRIKQKLRRMALEIVENNLNEKELIVVGVVGNGVLLAQNLVHQLEELIRVPMQTAVVTLNKRHPSEVTITPTLNLTDKVVILVDDVANTGKTLLYAIKPLMAYQPRKVQTLVLVERSHKLFPVQADYVGLTVSTTVQEHITVETSENTITGAWLH